jgi:hypothetical protein
MNPPLHLSSTQQASDLINFLTRAKKMDEDGVVRLRAFGDVLVVSVAPIFTSNLVSDGPTAIGLRTLKLAEQTEIDSVVPISEVLQRLPLAENSGELEVPSEQKPASWTGISAPRSGWELVQEFSENQVSDWAKAGIKDVAESLPDSVGGPVAARIRAQIWSRPVDIGLMLPGAAAFAMAGLGFLVRDESVKVFRVKNWLRLSTSYGHVITRESSRIT